MDDTIMTTECSAHMDDGYEISRAHNCSNYSPIASDSSCLANNRGGIASLPGPLSDPAVRELWILFGSYCWYGPACQLSSLRDRPHGRLTRLVPALRSSHLFHYTQPLSILLYLTCNCFSPRRVLVRRRRGVSGIQQQDECRWEYGPGDVDHWDC